MDIAVLTFLLTILVCTFVLGLGITLIRKDIEELKEQSKDNLIKNK